MSEQRAAGSRTLGELLEELAAEPSGRAWDFRLPFTRDAPQGFRLEGEDRALSLTYADLLACSRRAALALARRGVQAGDRVLLLLPTGLPCLAAFFGCQLLGAMAVPLVPPWSVERLRAHVERIERVATACTPRAAVIEPAVLELMRLESAFERSVLSSVQRLSGEDLLAERESWSERAAGEASATAILQFTSGSTAEPKGVAITHAAVGHNCRFIMRALGVAGGEVSCSWLPLFHDMGLVGHLLAPMFARDACVLLPPELFARQPRLWLEAMTRYGGTVSSAPNFAYDLCATRIADRDLERLDLRRWRVAMCGGEPVLPATLRRFAERFAKVGFRESSFRPVYGLAEATLAVTIPESRTTPLVDRVERQALELGRATPLSAGSSSEVVDIVGVGRPESVDKLRITGEQGEVLGERELGAIEVSGPALMRGYFQNEAATREAFRDGWLRTGDLGYLASGELFVVGRIKEVIMKGGRNLYPYDVEAAASAVQGVRAGRVVAFGVLNAETGTDDLILVCETRVSGEAAQRELTRTINAAVFAATGVRPDTLHLAPPGTLTKTSSGKLQRARARERFVSGDLAPGRAGFFTRLRASMAFIMR